MANVITDSLARAVTYDVTGDIDPADRPLHRDLSNYCDCPYPNATLAAIAESQLSSPGNRTGGDMDITITLLSGESVTLLAVVWNATASAVQTALDAAAAITITDYTAGDIVVANGPFGDSGAPVPFIFSGDSVHGNHPLMSYDGTNLTGGTLDPIPVQAVAGVVPRFWFASLKAMGVITGTDPAFAAAPAGQYSVTTRDELANYPSDKTIRSLIREATVQEGQDWEAELLPLLNLN